MDITKCPAPTPALTRLDRAWRNRERDGCITVSTVVGDPDCNGKPYRLTITVEAV